MQPITPASAGSSTTFRETTRTRSEWR
uniref:Uncharacterized protein n=1 Tax=Anguilla anguilla TaxID=7936 RepID=A0A0E9R979_ANGAN